MFLCGSFFGGSSTLFCVSAWDALCMVGSAWDALSGSLEVYGIHLGEVVGYQTYYVGPVPTGYVRYDAGTTWVRQVRRGTSCLLILPGDLSLVSPWGFSWSVCGTTARLSSVMSVVRLTCPVYICR